MYGRTPKLSKTFLTGSGHTACMSQQAKDHRSFLTQAGCWGLLGIAFALAAAGGVVQADDLQVADLTADQQDAVDSVRESSVLATVSFLASDEMAGRNTPSKELEIASAYVAARFRGAGLEGLGADGSFYQTTEIIQTGPAASGLQLTLDDKPVATARVLFGTGEVVQIEGELKTAAEGSEAAAPVVMDDLSLPPQLRGNPAGVIAMWSRRVKTLAESGASSVFVRTPQDSPLWQITSAIVANPIRLPSQFDFVVPVVLLDDTVQAGQLVRATIPANTQIAAPVHNVIGVLRGSDAELSQQAIIISAHLDHIGTRGDGEDRINNGADDNATGVTAVLAMADAFAALKNRPQRSVIFMTFWGEEKGLLGSKYFAQHPLWPLDQIVANINIEMIGRPETNAEEMAWGTGWTHSNLGDQMAAGAARVGVRIFHHEQFSEMLYARSDNYSFVQAGVIAHSFSAGSLHTDYHQPSDEVEKLNIRHMTRVIQGLFAGTLPIASGELTPARSTTTASP